MFKTTFDQILTMRRNRAYGGKVRPCLCTCPFVPVCPFVPENQPRRDQGQLETKTRNLVEHFAENFRLCWNSSCQFFSCYTYHLFIAWVWQDLYEVLYCSRGDFQEKFSFYVEIFSKSVKIVSFCPWISIFCVFLCTLRHYKFRTPPQYRPTVPPHSTPPHPPPYSPTRIHPTRIFSSFSDNFNFRKRPHRMSPHVYFSNFQLNSTLKTTPPYRPTRILFRFSRIIYVWGRSPHVSYSWNSQKYTCGSIRWGRF